MFWLCIAVAVVLFKTLWLRTGFTPTTAFYLRKKYFEGLSW
jgi:hypothetical protein